MNKVIDKRYEMTDYDKARKIIEDAMVNARKKIPEGKVATYIPELGKADPNQLGLAMYTLTGEKICVGDWDRRFTIQSITKVIMYIIARQLFGIDKIKEVVGAEPSGEAFNSLVELDQKDSKPYNPLINSGALAICGMLINEISFQDYLRFTRKICDDKDIFLNEDVYASEMKTCSRNRAIAYLLESKGIIKSDVEDTLKFYTKCCSLNVTSASLAHLGCILANDGVSPITEKRFMPSIVAREAKILMLTCGMYDNSGTFAISVGIPSKSGVGGGLLSVSDKRAGIGVFSPALDSKGNSIAGMELLKGISSKLRLNLFYDPEWNEENPQKTESDEILRHEYD